MSRAHDFWRALRVGVLVLLAIALVSGGIWSLGETSRVWSHKVNYVAHFRNVQGLARGSTVSVAGYTIGTVTDIALPEDIAAGLMAVTLSVERDNVRFIRGDTRARLKTLGLLGDRYIDLTLGTKESDELPAGSVIQAIQPPNIDEILEQGESVADNLVVLTASLRQMVDKISRGEGFLGAMVNDTEKYKQLTEDVRLAASSLRSIAEKADSGSGLAAVLLNDERPGQDLKRSLAAMARVASALDKGEGLAARLVADKDLADGIISNIETASQDMQEFSSRLNNNRGLLNYLTEEDGEAERMLSDLEQTAASLRNVTSQIEAGEGSLGKMIHDETLYRGLNDIVAGASKSVITRWFIRRNQNAGAKERLAEPTAE